MTVSTAPSPERSSRLGFLLLDTLPVVAIGVVVFYVLTSRVADCYPVPSGSMEPTIHGDREQGDLVLVDKTAFWRTDRPKVYDLVVTRMPDKANLMVKRCLAIGPATLRIAGGDLYRKTDGRFGSLPVAKDPVAQADMRIPVFRHPHLPCEQVLEEFFHLPQETSSVLPGGDVVVKAVAADFAAVLALLDPAARRPQLGESALRIPGFVLTNKPVDTSYLSPAGRRMWEGANYYPDIGIALDVLLPPGVGVAFVLEHHERDHVLVYDAGGVRLVLDGKPAKRVPVDSYGGPQRLVFGYLDGHLFLVRHRQAGGEQAGRKQAGGKRAGGEQGPGEKLFHEPLALQTNPDYHPGRPNGLQFGFFGSDPQGAKDVRITRFEVFHDIAVTSVGGVHGIGPGEYPLEADHMFLLGDNSHDSTDSRGTLGGVPLSRLVGRPWAILAPSSRARFFVR